VLDVLVERGFRRVRGSVRVRFTANRPTDRLVFRLWPNGPMQKKEGQRLDVGAVEEDGRRLRVRRPGPTTLVAQLGRRLRTGGSVTVTLPWSLRVSRGSPDRIAAFASGLRLGSFFPILAWDPDRGWITNPPARFLAESSTTPTSDFDVRVRIPRGARALVSGDPAGPGRWRARAVRDVAVAVGAFHVRAVTARAPAPVRVRVAFTVPAALSPGAVVRTAKASIERLSRLYGRYPWRTYTVVLPPDLRQEGIEYPTLSFVGNVSATLVLRHETAHQWFYSLVGNDQYADPWLDETAATWAQTRLGSKGIAPRSAVRAHVGASLAYWNSRPRRYFAEVYGGGVRALRSIGAPASVDCALRLYVARNAYRIARPGDLLDALDAFLPRAEAQLRRFGIHR
jgi:Peptidase family M1 domain